MPPLAAVEAVDWWAYAATKGLSDKQQKLADKIRKREVRVQNLQREIERIRAKAGKETDVMMEELSSGQAATMARRALGRGGAWE